MTTPDQTQTYLAAVSGVGVTELVQWTDLLGNGRGHNYKLAYQHGRWELLMQWDQQGEWHVEAQGYLNHEAAALIRTAVQDRLDENAVWLHVSFNGKTGCSASFTAHREYRNDDGYFEGDGPKAVLLGNGTWGVYSQYKERLPRLWPGLKMQREGEYAKQFDERPLAEWAAYLALRKEVAK